MFGVDGLTYIMIDDCTVRNGTQFLTKVINRFLRPYVAGSHPRKSTMIYSVDKVVLRCP